MKRSVSVSIEKLQVTLSYEKGAREILVKLTPGKLLCLFQRTLNRGPPAECSAGHGHCSVEQTSREWREDVVVNGGSSGLLTHDGNVVGVTTEGCDIFLHPLQCCDLVE